MAVMTILFACQDNLKNENLLNDDQKELIIDEALQSILIDELLSDIDAYSDFGEGLLKSASVLADDCPVNVTVDRPDEKPYWPRTVTLDFGDGCTNARGKLKSGIMIIEKSAPWRESGATRRVTFDGYTVDGKLFEGVKELVNKTEEGGDPTFEIAAELRISYMKTRKNEEGENEEVEVVVERKVNKTQVWVADTYRDKDWSNNQFYLTGESKIVKVVGNEKKEIKKEYEEIWIKRGCRFPQGGVKKFKVTTFDGLELKFVLDYNATEDGPGEKCGDGCDCMAMLTYDKEQELLDLSERWWKQVRDKSKED